MTTSEKARQMHREHPDWSNYKIAQILGCDKTTVRTALLAKHPNQGRPPKEETPTKPMEVFKADGDTAVATIVYPNLYTLDQVLERSQADLKTWEVKNYVCKKWEVGTKHPVTGEVTVTPLWGYTINFRRRTNQALGLESLIERLEKTAKPLPAIKRPHPARLSPKRTLELCIMDPHIGLLCNYPESDAPWDLELAAGAILQAMDDLIARAESFGPFSEVVMPFGNDFVHTDNLEGSTSSGTNQPEGISWHRVYDFAESVAIAMVERVRKTAPSTVILEIPGNHSRVSDFTLARLLRAYFRTCPDVRVDARSTPYKFHRAGVNLIGYEHGHSVNPVRLAALMANECREDWAQTEYREFHLGDQHRKGSSKPSMLEEQGVSIEYIPGLTAPNEWHRLKSFSHQKRGAMAFVWDHTAGPIARLQHNISMYHHKPLKCNQSFS